MKEDHTNETVTETIFESIDTVEDLKDIKKVVKQISDPVMYKHPSKMTLIRLWGINEDQLSVETSIYYMNPYIKVFSAKNAVLSPLLLEYDLRKIISGRLDSNCDYQNFKQHDNGHISTPELKRKTRLNRKSERKKEISNEKHIEAFINKMQDC